VNRTLQVTRGNAGTHDGGRRQIAVGFHGHFDVVHRLRDEDAVERQDDAVVVLDMSGDVVV
jgi:hypothetical protein